MRGLDTNVLVRFLTADEPAQSESARRLIETAEATDERLHVSTLVLAELVWVLRGGRYALSRNAVADAVEALLEANVFEIQDRDIVRSAVTDFRDGSADFSDYLIGEHDRRAGCTSTLTFDRRLAKAEGFEALDSEGSYPTQVSEP
jgi:predicted nucleic-acid-binding protein